MATQQPLKKQKVEERTNNCKEEVLFNSDTLSKVVSFLPSVDVLNLAVTCTRFGVSNNDDDSIIKESVRISIQDIATEEELAALPHYEGESSLADYHYLQLMKEPLNFDQLTVGAEYVNCGDISYVRHVNCSGVGEPLRWGTAFSNNILRAGKHYASTHLGDYRSTNGGSGNVVFGVMRPGQINENASGYPIEKSFYRNFSRRLGHEECNNENSIQCCMYYAYSGKCVTSDWNGPIEIDGGWHGMQNMSSGDEIGMLLDLDEGTLSVYKNGRKLGILKRGLAGPYCWVASMWNGTSVTIKRGIPPS